MLSFWVLLFGLLQGDDLALKSQQARQLMAAGRFSEAIPVYRELVRAVPDNPGLLLNLGLAQQMAGQPREALPNLQAAVKLEPKLFPAWASLGACYMDLGEPARALAPLEKAAGLDPRNTQVRSLLAEALLATERFEPAARQYRTLGETEPANPKIWYGLGRSYEGLARQTFERLNQAGAGSAWWLALVAEIRLSQAQYSSAFTLYRDALKKMPGLRGVNAALARVYRQTGHADWAAAAEKKERELPPPDCAASPRECAFLAGRYLDAARAARQPTPETLFWQARAYNALAEAAFARLGGLPPSAELHRIKAQIASGHGRPQEAAKELRQALQLSPADPQLRLDLAVALHDSRDFTGAEEIVAELLKANPDNGLLNFMYGDTLLRLEQPEKAIPYLEKAVRADPKQLPAQASLGLAYGRTGQPEKAIAHLKPALDYDTDGSLHYQLGRAYQATGQPEAAREMLRQYQQIQQKAKPGQPDITGP